MEGAFSPVVPVEGVDEHPATRRRVATPTRGAVKRRERIVFFLGGCSGLKQLRTR
jgi:hypothetical protein